MVNSMSDNPQSRNIIGKSTGEWYVVHCISRRETQTASALMSKLDHAEVYAPKLLRRRGAENLSAPLFPGYIFINVEMSAVGPGQINTTPGVLKLLEISGTPQKLAPGTVEAIQERIELLNSGKQPLRKFKTGEPVRLSDGPFKGLEAIFLGPVSSHERVRILLEFLGQPREIQIEQNLLEPAPNAITADEINSTASSVSTSTQNHRSERRTRGRGRFINKAQG